MELDHENIEFNYLEETIKSLDARMENIRIYYPFYKIMESRTEEFSSYDIPTFCLSILSFLLHEGKLKYKAISFKDIAGFVTQFSKEAYGKDLDGKEAKNLTTYIIGKIDNNGQHFTFPYYSCQANHHKEKRVKLIETKIEDEFNSYHITEDGIDFFLKTKEFPEESQLTLNMLLLRQQIKSKAFDYALDTVKRIHIQIQKDIEKKKSVLEALLSNDIEGLARYRQYHIEMIAKLKGEQELFKDIKDLIQKTKEEFLDKLTKGQMSQKEKNAKETLQETEYYLLNANEKHTQLLGDANKLISQKSEIFSQKLKNLFTEKFNFDNEFNRLVKRNESPSSLKYIIEPLFTQNLKRSFNPLKVFEPQKLSFIKDNDEYEEAEVKKPIDMKERDHLIDERIKHNFKTYIDHLLNMFKEQDEFILSEWVDQLKDDFGSDVILNSEFTSFLIALNQDKLNTSIKTYYIYELRGKTEKQLTQIEMGILEAIKNNENLMFCNSLSIKPNAKELIDFGCGVKITNLIFKMEGSHVR